MQDDKQPSQELVPYTEPLTPHRRVRRYSDFERFAILEYVIEEVEDGGNVLKAMQECDVPLRNFYDWIPKHPDLEKRFIKARDNELKMAYEKIIDIENRLILPETNPNWISPKSGLAALNSLFWRLERLERNRYGKEVKHSIGVEDYEGKLIAAKLRVENRFKDIDHVAG